MLILKGFFFSSILRRIRWNNSKSIHRGMLFPCCQIIEILICTLNHNNITCYFAIFIYCILSLLISKLLLDILLFFPFDYRVNRNVKNEENDFVYIVKKSELTPELNDMHGFYNMDITTFEDGKLEEFNIYTDSYNPLYNEKLSGYAKNSLQFDNAGGKSDISEAWSIHHLMNITNSSEVIYEMNVKYDFVYKMVDYILIKSNNSADSIGVSVVRAISYFGKEFTFEDGIKLLHKKIYGLIISRKSTNKIHNFNKSILHIWSPNQNTTDILIECINSNNFDKESLCIVGTLDIWITISNYKPIFTNGINKKIS